MARRSIYSTSLLAQVRRYFGLPQWELAAFLGVSPELVKHIEAGRRTITSRVLLQLNALALLLPAEPVRAEKPDSLHIPLTPVPAGPEADELLARLDECQHRTGRLRYQMRQVAAEWALARRWEQALPALLQTAPPDTDTTPAANRRRRWLAAREQYVQQTLGPAAARFHRLRVRAEALEAEAAGLETLLAGGAGAGETGGNAAGQGV